MYEFLKNLANDNDWHFEYSRSDYHNLYDGMEIDKVHLFVDPIEIDSKFSESGFEIKTFFGKMMILVSSDVDQTYSTKYETNIKPIIDNSLQIFKDAILCSDFEIIKFKTIETINLFDQNLDGILITYHITLPV